MTTTEESSLLIRSDVGSLSSSSRTSSPSRLHPLLSSLKKSPLMIVLASIVIVGLASLTALHHRRHTPSDIDNNNNNAALLSVYGSSRHDTKKKYNYKGEFPSTECEEDINYSKHTLKRAYDLPFSALFNSNNNNITTRRGGVQTIFEASSVTIINSDTVYAVCDSSFAISKFTLDLDPFSNVNVQIGDPSRHGSYESGYEAIFGFEGLIYVVRESIDHGGTIDHTHSTSTRRNLKKGKKRSGEKDTTTTTTPGDYHAIIEELSLTNDNYTLIRECRCEFAFEGASKGFEGAIGFPDVSGELYILALCEGNHCSNDKKIKKDVGNGRVVIMKKKINIANNSNPLENNTPTEEEECIWETVKIVKIPKSAAFLDYSDIDITSTGKVVISSQEESAVWLGHASGIVNGVIDPVTFEFVDSNTKSSSVLSFPKDTGCHTVYCHIEGIHFIDDQMLMAVSDKMKSGGKQDYRCLEKDQSIHAFVIP